VIEKIYYKILEFITLAIMFTLFGLVVAYLFLEMIILSVVSAFQSICRR